MNDHDEMMDKLDIAFKEYSDNPIIQNDKAASLTGMNLIAANLPKIWELLVSGETVTNICKMLGINRGIWYYMREQNIAFSHFLEAAQSETIAQVKKNLVTKCSDRFIQRDKVLPNGRIVQYDDFIPADINAIKFFLLNKAPEEFKEKQEIVVKRKEYNINIIDTDYQVVEDAEENSGTPDMDK